MEEMIGISYSLKTSCSVEVCFDNAPLISLGKETYQNPGRFVPRTYFIKTVCPNGADVVVLCHPDFLLRAKHSFPLLKAKFISSALLS